MKNKFHTLFIRLARYLERIISEELEIMDKFYHESTARNIQGQEVKTHA